MAFPNANFCFSPCSGAHSTTDGCRRGPPRPEEYTCASILPPHGHTKSQEGTVSSHLSRSIGMLPDCAMLGTGLDSELIRPVRNINGAFDISGSSHCMLPSDNQSILSGPFGCGLEDYDLTTSFAALDNFPSAFNLRGYFVSSQTTATEPGGFHDINSSGILNDDLQMPSSESFFFGHTG
jgi:hypothetical protein